MSCAKHALIGVVAETNTGSTVLSCEALLCIQRPVPTFKSWSAKGPGTVLVID